MGAGAANATGAPCQRPERLRAQKISLAAACNAAQSTLSFQLPGSFEVPAMEVDMEVSVSEAPASAAAEPLYRYDLPIEEDPVRGLLDRRVPWIIHDEVFSQQSFGTGPWPDQGWKLHVSATPLSAVDVLDRTLDVLLRSEEH